MVGLRKVALAGAEILQATAFDVGGEVVKLALSVMGVAVKYVDANLKGTLLRKCCKPAISKRDLMPAPDVNAHQLSWWADRHDFL